VTSFEHIVNDFLRNIAEDDLTHLKEVLSLHDLVTTLAPEATSNLNYAARIISSTEPCIIMCSTVIY